VYFEESPKLVKDTSPPHSGQKCKASKKPSEAGGKLRWSKPHLAPAFAVFMLDLFFYPEDVGDTFLRNVGLSPKYLMLQPRREYSS
jgi:hypothetical protein